MKKLFFIRPTEPNYGDVMSRYGILKLLSHAGNRRKPVVLSCQVSPELEEHAHIVRPGILKDLFPRWEQICLYTRGDKVCWAGGHDLQDDSSLLKLPFLICKFLFYRICGLKIRIVAQGAGPIGTTLGKLATRIIMSLVESASFRDQESLELISSIAPASRKKYALVIDGALFAPETTVKKVKHGSHLLLGVNLRRWFHFDKHWMPYEYRIKLGLLNKIPGAEEMEHLIQGMAIFLDKLAGEGGIRIRMISMYPPNIEPWEDDLDLLRKTRDRMIYKEQVEIIDKGMSPKELIDCFSELDLMIGMRLHSTIIASALGIPSLHIAYSPKGYSFFSMIGQRKFCFPVEDLLKEENWKKFEEVFRDLLENRDTLAENISQTLGHLKNKYSSSFFSNL